VDIELKVLSGVLRTIENFREKGSSEAHFSRNRVENTGLSLLEGVNSWVLSFFVPFVSIRSFFIQLT